MPLGMIWTGVKIEHLVLAFVLYFVRMFFITGGFHRYFAHRTFELNRFWQFIFAFGAQTSAQRGALWWAAHHRHHHRYSDQPEDIHSPHQGFWYSHIGWIVDPKHRETDYNSIKDFAKYPELRFLNKFHVLPAVLLGAACAIFGGAGALFTGFFLSTVVLYHGTFTINSITHLWGTRRYATRDTSRNNFLLAVITLGEGWHNNHHHYKGCARQGFFWYEIDMTYYILRLLALVGVVKNMREPTAEAKEKNRLRDGHVDLGMFTVRWAKAAEALNLQRARTGRFYEERRSAVEELVARTRDTAEEIADKAKTATAARKSNPRSADTAHNATAS
jgi:stearoyl-CoA desaturase (delta-9 desaturase)